MALDFLRFGFRFLLNVHSFFPVIPSEVEESPGAL
jgi:hypothetical protein